MKIYSIISRMFATAAIGFSLASGCAYAATTADNNTDQAKQEWVKRHEEMKQEWTKRREEMRAEHMKRFATRLGITAAQEKDWQAFTTVLNAMPSQIKHPDANADAATIARFEADMAAEHAKKLGAMADATSKLQAILTPEQRKTFDEMAHSAMRRNHHSRHHHFWHHASQHGWHHEGQWQHNGDGKDMRENMPSKQ